MKLRLSLCVAAIAMLIAATGLEATMGGKVRNMRERFQSMRGGRGRGPARFTPSYAAAASSASAAGSGSAAASAAATGAAGGYVAPVSRYASPAHQPVARQSFYAPAAAGSASSAATSGGVSSSAAAAAAGRGGAAASSAAAGAGGYGHGYGARKAFPRHESRFGQYDNHKTTHGHSYGQGHGHGHGHGHDHGHGYGHGYGHGHGHEVAHAAGFEHGHGHGASQATAAASASSMGASHGEHGHAHRQGFGHHGHGHGQHEHFAFEPEVAQTHHEPSFAPPRYAPVVHPPVPSVAPKFFGGHRAGADSGVSTSVAAAGSARAAAAAAAAAGAGAGTASGASAGAGAGASVGAGASGHHNAYGAGHGAHAAHSHQSAPHEHDSHQVENEHFSEHYSKPETVERFGAQTGTYANDGRGVVTSSYVRSTDNEEEHEDGRADSDHYYKAGSYGKTLDENHHESYENDDEEVVHKPHVFHSKKSKTNYNKDISKARRESGSNVLAQDKHSEAYNRDRKKFKENVDQKFHAEGQGVLETGNSSERSDFDEESESRFDSRNLGDFVGVDGVRHDKRPVFNPAAAAAATASSAGVSSTSSAGGR